MFLQITSAVSAFMLCCSFALAQTPQGEIKAGTLLHTADFGLGLFRTVEDAVGVTGPEVSVTSATPPYGGSRRLITSAASTCPFDATPSHLSTAVDLCTPDGLYAPAWRYLAGSS